MRRIWFAGAATLLVAGMLGSTSAQTITYTVGCSMGQTVSAAIRRGDARQPLEVVVRGTCNECVLIDRDDVTLRGASRRVSTAGRTAPCKSQVRASMTTRITRFWSGSVLERSSSRRSLPRSAMGGSTSGAVTRSRLTPLTCMRSDPAVRVRPSWHRRAHL